MKLFGFVWMLVVLPVCGEELPFKVAKGEEGVVAPVSLQEGDKVIVKTKKGVAVIQMAGKAQTVWEENRSKGVMNCTFDVVLIKDGSVDVETVVSKYALKVLKSDGASASTSIEFVRTQGLMVGGEKLDWWCLDDGAVKLSVPAGVKYVKVDGRK